ncbi:MAG: type 4a pilus biogenesis protein PilO [Nitrospiria bacterium]
MALNLESFKNLPQYQKITLAILLIVVLVGGFSYFIYIPKNNQIEELKSQIAHLTQEVKMNQAKIQRLETLKQEHAQLQQQLAQQMEQLPSEAEVPALLKQVSELGTRIGLDFKLWRPAPQKPGPEGLYTEVPVEVEVAGGYHSVAMFFDRISKLQRIVNVIDIKMANAKFERNRVLIQTTFKAVAFSILPGGAEGQSQSPKSTTGGQNTKKDVKG